VKPLLGYSAVETDDPDDHASIDKACDRLPLFDGMVAVDLSGRGATGLASFSMQ
jgi:hypothetical protein